MSVLSTFAAELAAEAGALARRRFYSGRYRTESKSGGEPVTDADRAVEQLIIDRVAEKYPQHGVLGEEYGTAGDQENCWVIDPIDGTTNFIHQYPHCAVSLAFCEKGRPIAGAIHDIAYNETFVAARGEGAFLHNRRLRVSATSSVSASLFAASGSMNGDMWELVKTMAQSTSGMRRSGATALDLAAVAAGRIDMLLSGPVRFWDVAAGTLLIREAGGLLADVDEQTAFIFGEPTRPFAAGAPGVFAPYLRALKNHCT